MKKLTLILAVTLMISTGLVAQNDVENTAKEILKAYKTKDTELLKKNASGVLKYAISDSYFEDENLQRDIKAAENWDGEIRGIGYVVNNIAGKKIIMASVYFADIPNSDSIYEVLLSNYENQGWVMFGAGLGADKKENFESLNKTLSSGTAPKAAKTYEGFSVEMANGDTFDEVSPEKIKQFFDKLDDDNFFIILNHKDDFLQAAYSDGSYMVEYKDNGVQYSAADVLSKEKTIELFNKYLDTDKDWNKDIQWEKQ